MKKLALLFAGLSLIATTGCKDDDIVQVFPLVGVWKPIGEVRTEVDLNGVGFSDQITYTPCQQNSRWVFNENFTGTRVNNDEVGSPATCSVVSSRNFTYTFYNGGDGNVEIKYQGTVVPEKGKVILLNAERLNLKIENTADPGYYKSVTYTFQRIPQ